MKMQPVPNSCFTFMHISEYRYNVSNEWQIDITPYKNQITKYIVAGEWKLLEF